MLHAKVNGIIAELCRRKAKFSSDIENNDTQPKKVRASRSSIEYAEDGGMHCPYCGSYIMTSEGLEIDDNEIWQKISCLDCKETWHDVYRLAGYRKI